MIQLEFVLYRFVCDISTFTGLFAEDAEGRSIPDTAAFHCTWSRSPRTKQVSAAVSERVGGSTDSIYFKALGADMALTFTTDAHHFHIDGEKEVVTFALRPSQYSEDGPLPVIAKGTLDPSPYFDKPKKNYAIKLRDAAGQVTGKLLFSLVVQAIEGNGSQAGTPDRNAADAGAGAALAAGRSGSVRSPKSPGSRSLDGSQKSLSRNPARDRLFKTTAATTTAADTTSPRQPSLHSGSTPPSRVPATTSEAPRATGVHAPPAALERNSPRCGSPSATSQSKTYASAVPVASSTAQRNNNNNSNDGAYATGRCIESVDVQLERIAVRSEGIDLEHPAPLLLGGDYNLKIRYGSFSYSTTRCVCCNPKEVEYRGQQTCISLQSPPSGEKLRFSLWEDKKQVAGFSLDPAKFTATPGVWKEYAIPFRYHPTGQKAALDVRVRRLVVPLDGSPAGRHSRTPPSHRQPTMTTGATEPIAFPAEGEVPRRLTYQADTAAGLSSSGDNKHNSGHYPQQRTTPLRTTTTSPKKQRELESNLSQHVRDAGSPRDYPPTPSERATPLRTSQPARGNGGGASPPGSIIVTRGFLQSGGGDARDGTPHRFYDANSDRSAHTGLRSSNPASAVVRSGWEKTPLQQRPPPLTQNLADLPADRRPPDDHESYIAEVLARLNRQPRGSGRQPTSLMEEWMGWRDERERSRCNSVANSVVRSNSVSSVVSRADSLASVTSRHASVPRATKSNADHSLLVPFTPDNTRFRKRRSSPSPAARNPLV